MNRIRQLRIESGLTQTELGKMLNVKDSAISKYENEKIPLTAETLIKLKRIFGVSIDYILCVNDLSTSKDTEQNNTATAIPQFSKDVAAMIEYYTGFSAGSKEKALEYFDMLKKYEESKNHD